MKITLIDLPKRKDLIGKKINIVRQGGEYHYEYQDTPKMRIFKGAKIKKQYGKFWIYWYWEPSIEGNGNGIMDCGYSGAEISDLYGNSYLSIGDIEK